MDGVLLTVLVDAPQRARNSEHCCKHATQVRADAFDRSIDVQI
jgi:hypothetical protein